MKEIKKVAQAARRQWYLVIGIRWQRVQAPVLSLYFRRVTLPVRFWRACGSPSQFRPRLPWWQPLVWRWLVLSGAFGPMHPSSHHPLRRPSRWRSGANAEAQSHPAPYSTSSNPMDATPATPIPSLIRPPTMFTSNAMPNAI